MFAGDKFSKLNCKLKKIVKRLQESVKTDISKVI